MLQFKFFQDIKLYSQLNANFKPLVNNDVEFIDQILYIQCCKTNAYACQFIVAGTYTRLKLLQLPGDSHAEKSCTPTRVRARAWEIPWDFPSFNNSQFATPTASYGYTTVNSIERTSRGSRI